MVFQSPTFSGTGELVATVIGVSAMRRFALFCKDDPCSTAACRFWRGSRSICFGDGGFRAVGLNERNSGNDENSDALLLNVDLLNFLSPSSLRVATFGARRAVLEG